MCDDIDPLIVSLTDLPELIKLGCVNQYFYKLVYMKLLKRHV